MPNTPFDASASTAAVAFDRTAEIFDAKPRYPMSADAPLNTVIVAFALLEMAKDAEKHEHLCRKHHKGTTRMRHY